MQERDWKEREGIGRKGKELEVKELEVKEMEVKGLEGQGRDGMEGKGRKRGVLGKDRGKEFMYVCQTARKKKGKIVHFPGYNIFLSRRSFSTDI